MDVIIIFAMMKRQNAVIQLCHQIKIINHADNTKFPSLHKFSMFFISCIIIQIFLKMVYTTVTIF